MSEEALYIVVDGELFVMVVALVARVMVVVQEDQAVHIHQEVRILVVHILEEVVHTLLPLVMVEGYCSLVDDPALLAGTYSQMVAGILEEDLSTIGRLELEC